jgi:hypothetical protein
MRIQLITAAAVLLLSAAGATAQTRPAAIPNDEQPHRTQTALPTPSLIGTWKSAADEMKLTSDFDKSVWGANATSVRTVELTVRSNTEATLRVVKKVVNAKGGVVPASTWIEEAQLQLGDEMPGVADRIEHQVTVMSAVRLFPDDPNYKWAIDGLKVKVVTFTDRDPNTLEVRYDTPDGRGSFWETLKRGAAAATAKPAATTPKTQRPTPKAP